MMIIIDLVKIPLGIKVVDNPTIFFIGHRLVSLVGYGSFGVKDPGRKGNLTQDCASKIRIAFLGTLLFA